MGFKKPIYRYTNQAIPFALLVWNISQLIGFDRYSQQQYESINISQFIGFVDNRNYNISQLI